MTAPESRRLRTQAERDADGTALNPPRLYGWLPCLACGSDRHYVDDCDNADALAAYYADDEEPR